MEKITNMEQKKDNGYQVMATTKTGIPLSKSVRSSSTGGEQIFTFTTNEIPLEPVRNDTEEIVKLTKEEETKLSQSFFKSKTAEQF